jgi:hypothetical protein
MKNTRKHMQARVINHAQSLLSLAITFLCASHINAQTWNGAGGDMNWNNPTNWGGVNGYVPNGGQVNIDIVRDPENPVLIGANMVGYSGLMNVGAAGNDNSAGYLTIDGGIYTNAAGGTVFIGGRGYGEIHMKSGYWRAVGAINVGRNLANATGNPRGVLKLSGGTIDATGSTITVGAHTTVVPIPGDVIQTGGEMITGNLNVGYGSDNLGTFTISNGTLVVSSTAKIGASSGPGLFVNDGGSVTFNRLDIGADYTLSAGEFLHNSGTLAITGDFLVANVGTAVFKANADFNVSGTTHLGYKTTPAPVKFELGAITATLANLNVACVVGSEAEVVLKDTLLKTGNINIRGANGFAAGKIRGWGRIEGGNIKNSGKIIADGFGAPRDLDFTYYVDDIGDNNTYFAEPQGWYAENCGRILFPVINVAQTAGEVRNNIGDRNLDLTAYNTTDLANSFRIVMTNPAEGEIRPSLLAPDHPEIPAGLADKILSVWNCETPVFTNATAVFRYDESKEFDMDRTRLVRYENGVWNRVQTTSVNTTDHRITTAPFAPVGASNFGMFAFVERPLTTVIIIK